MSRPLVKELDIYELVNHPIFGTPDVIRYSGVYQAHPESLADHILDCQLLSSWIASELAKRGEELDTGLLLQKCLWHDMDEVLTGDIPRNTKYCSSEAHDALTKVSKISMDQLLDDSPFIKELYIKVWDEAKTGKEGLILKIVDMLSVVKKTIKELEFYSNKAFLQIAVEVYYHIKSLVNGDLLQQYIQSTEARNYLEVLLDSARSALSKYLADPMIKQFSIKSRVVSEGE